MDIVERHLFGCDGQPWSPAGLPQVEELTRDQYDEVDALVSDIKAAVAEACGENPDLHEDDVAYEITNSYLYGELAPVKAEVKRRMGF